MSAKSSMIYTISQGKFLLVAPTLPQLNQTQLGSKLLLLAEACTHSLAFSLFVLAGRLTRSSGASLPGAPSITLGSTCSEQGVSGHLSLKLDFTFKGEGKERGDQVQARTQSTQAFEQPHSSRRQLLHTRVSPELTNVVVNARITEPGPSVVTGVGSEVDTTQWENKAAAENVEQSGGGMANGMLCAFPVQRV